MRSFDSLLSLESEEMTVMCLRGAVKKNPSIFKDIVQIGGREVNPISKKSKEMIF